MAESTDVNETAGEQTASIAPGARTQDFDCGPGPAVASNVLVPGYKMLGILGRGGMGVVYKAVQEKANRLVALKMILAGAHADQHDRTRFQVEAAAAARMSHPNIVQLYEVGETPDGFPFFSLEFVSGGTLADRLKQAPLRPQEAAALVEALARAMQYAHERGIVHRDLKPLNILLAETGGKQQAAGVQTTMKPQPTSRTIGDSSSSALPSAGGPLPAVPKISDFGLAKQLDSEDGLTRTGAIMGSPAYMAPEQAFGQSKNVGPAADIYALGAILYECLTGRPPFKGATIADTLEQVRTMEPITLSAFAKEIPRDLETICLHCLHKDPQRRYASAEALADDLRRYCEGQPITVRPVGTPERVLRWCRRNPGWAAMIGLVAVSLIGVAGVSLFAYLEVSAQYVVAETKRKEAVDARDEATKKTKEAQIAREKEKEKTELAKTRLEQSLKAVGLFATDARIYCEDAMVPGESRRRLYGVLIKQLEEQAAQASGESTFDALRNKIFLYQTLCAVNHDFREYAESKKWYDKGLASVEQWEKILPGDPPAQAFRATLFQLRASSLNILQDFEEANRLNALSLAIRRKLVDDPDVDLPGKVDSISALADSLDSLEQFVESLTLRTKVVKLYQEAEKKHAFGSPMHKEAKERSFPYREALCWTYHKAALHATDYAKRKEYLTNADQMSDELMQIRPTNRNVLSRWALNAKTFGELEYNHGKLAERDGKPEEAQKYFLEAQKHFAKLNEQSKRLATSNELIDGVRDYSRSFYTLGLVERLNGNPTRARAHFESSRELRELAFRDYGNSALSTHLLIDLLFSQIALGETTAAMAKIDGLILTFQSEPSAAYRLACLYALAIQALDETRKPNPLTPADERVRRKYCNDAIHCLHVAYDGGFSDFFQSSIDADLDAIRDDPRMKELEAGHSYRLGVLAKKHGDAKKARAHFEKSRDLANEFMKTLPTDRRFKHVKIAWLCARVQLGDYAKALKSADDLWLSLNKIDPAVFRLARVYSLASAAVEDPKLQEECRTKALAALNQAAKAELAPRLVAEDDLEPLRDDPRFKETQRLYAAKR